MKIKEKEAPKYLTEEKLGKLLINIMPDFVFIHDKSVPESKNNRARPDYRCESLKIIIEFDGDSHYCKSERIIRDKLKDEDYSLLGYKIFRIPYFIQVSSTLLENIFGESIDYKQEYENGFIDDKATLPSDFCELGIESFKKDLDKFNYCREDIINSLKLKIKQKGNIDLVLPKSLRYLVED